MEASKLTIDIIIVTLANPSNKALSQRVVNFLDAADLKILSEELQKSSSKNQFSQLIRTYYFLTNYLNKVDRTFYYSFYEEDQFRNIQIAQTGILANNYSNCFFQFQKQYKSCLIFIEKLFPQCVQPSEFVLEIERMITDTDIPMPKLKRQNQGIFCKSSFQNYLVYLRFKNESFNDYEQVFQNINAYFVGRQQTYLQKLFMKASKDQVLNKKIRFLRFTPYDITYQNFPSCLVANNSLHNVLVGLFALTDVWLNSIKSYMASLQDPFHRYVQLITRYSIYRNYVISVQQNLSFIFEQYNELYSQVFGGGKPAYRFWRPAMTKWMLKFQQFHQQCSSIFYYCLTKQRTQACLKYLEEKEQECPQIYMTIKNRMTLREYEMELNETLFPTQMRNGMQDFFEKDMEQYQVITVEYMEYMVDLSINEETVHWCGHSDHKLSQPFLSFEKYILAENRLYMNYIRETVTDGYNHAHHSNSNRNSNSSINNGGNGNSNRSSCMQKQFYQQQLSFLQTLQFKPTTLKKLAQCYSNQISQLLIQAQQQIIQKQAYKQAQKEAQKQTQIDVHSQQIVYDSRKSDQTLKYFNEKANIKFQLSKEQMCFYSIAPLVTTEELLTKSISTCFESEALEAQEQSDCQMEYFSRSSQVEGYDDHKRMREFDEQKDKSDKKKCKAMDDHEQEREHQKSNHKQSYHSQLNNAGHLVLHKRGSSPSKTQANTNNTINTSTNNTISMNSIHTINTNLSGMNNSQGKQGKNQQNKEKWKHNDSTLSSTMIGIGMGTGDINNSQHSLECT